MFRYWLLLTQLTAMALMSSTLDTDAAGSTSDATDATESTEQTDEADDSEADADDSDGEAASGNNVQGTSYERGFNNLLERFGNNARRVAEHLYRQDFKHRENLRLARGEVDQLKQSMPKNGARLLDKTAARDFDAYRKLGKPGDLEAKLQAGTQAAQALQGRQKDDLLREVAEVTNWNYKALKGAASDLDYTVKEVEENGQKRRKAFVVTKSGDQTTETAAQDWFQQNKDFLMPSLTAGAGGVGGQQTYGQQFIQQPVNQQRSNGSQQPVSAAAAVLSRYDEPKKPQ